MIVSPLTLADALTVLKWRNGVPETLRTEYPLTEEMQIEYYKNVICDRKSNTRYVGFHKIEMDDTGEEEDVLIGYGGIENIQWAYKTAEISLIVNPECRRKGIGRKIVDYILDMAFNTYNMEVVWGEVYCCAAIEFWIKIIKEKNAFHVVLPKRKFYKGKYWNSIYFSFDAHPEQEIK